MAVAPEALVAVASSVPVLLSLLATVRKWLAARGNKKVKIVIDGRSIELEDGNEKQAEQMVKIWLARHSNNPDNMGIE
jgi:hypothetical protein